MKFSIITCTYNSEDYIQNNINSVKAQSFRDFEHIFIDGFSTDKTKEIIGKYQKEFPDNVRFYQCQPKGIANAMNEGIKKAKGEYINHLHSDDSFYEPETLEKISTFIEENNKPDWIYGKINVVEEDDSSIGNFPKYKFLQSGNTFFGRYLLKFINFIPHQSVFIRTNIFDVYEDFDESLKSSMDFDLWLRIRKQTHWIFFDEIISNYKVRPEAQSSGVKNQSENLRNLRKVQSRYMNKFEIYVSYLITYLLNKINKTLR